MNEVSFQHWHLILQLKSVPNFHAYVTSLETSASGYEKCTLVSHDWGGAVAYATAEMFPDIIEKLIVCNCPHFKAFIKIIQKSFLQLRKSW